MATRGTVTSLKPKGGPPGGRPPEDPPKSKAPQFHIWLSQQVAQTDQEMADAARYIVGRWAMGAHYKHAVVVRILDREDSPHLYGARALADLYCEMFDVVETDQLQHRNSVHPMRPVDRERCEHQFASGRTCGRDSIPGTGLCQGHGGQWITEEDFDRISRSIRNRMIHLSDTATGVLADLMDNAKSEIARLQAAQTVLRITGFDPANGGNTVNINVNRDSDDTALDPTDIVMRRLEALSPAATPIAAREDEIYDAEVLEESG